MLRVPLQIDLQPMQQLMRRLPSQAQLAAVRPALRAHLDAYADACLLDAALAEAQHMRAQDTAILEHMQSQLATRATAADVSDASRLCCVVEWDAPANLTRAVRAAAAWHMDTYADLAALENTLSEMDWRRM